MAAEISETVDKKNKDIQSKTTKIVAEKCRKILKGKETCRLHSTIIQKKYRGGESLNNSQKQRMASADQHKLL